MKICNDILHNCDSTSPMKRIISSFNSEIDYRSNFVQNAKENTPGSNHMILVKTD